MGRAAGRVVIGMDPHKRSATIEVIDEHERVLAQGWCGTDTDGYQQMLTAARKFPGRVWAVEGCAGIGRHIAQRLVADGETVLDVPAKLPVRVRVFDTGQGRRPAPERDEHAVDVDEGERSRDAGWRLDVRHVHIGELPEAGQHPPVAAEMAGHAGRVSTEQERLASRRSQVFVKVGRLAWPPLSQIGSLIVNLAVKTYLVIVLLALPTVMFGGFSLLRLSLANRLNDYQRGMFRAGHAHAGVLLVLSLASVSLMAFIGIGIGWIWFLGAVLVVGALAQSGGFFLNLAIGRPDRWSAGTTLTVVGAVLLSIAMVVLAIQVATSGALR